MNILALDTATEACSAAVLRGEEVFSRMEVIPRGHAERILGMCDEVLGEAGITRGDLSLVACGRGPGAFTGVRIAVAAAQGICLGLDLRLLGVSDLMILAQGCLGNSGAEMAACAFDARMGEVYLGIYRRAGDLAELAAEERVCSPEKAGEEIRRLCAGHSFIAAGTGFGAYPALARVAAETGAEQIRDSLLPAAADMLPWARSHAGEAVPPEDLVPLYLRNDVAWKKIGEQGPRGGTGIPAGRQG